MSLRASAPSNDNFKALDISAVFKLCFRGSTGAYRRGRSARLLALLLRARAGSAM